MRRAFRAAPYARVPRYLFPVLKIENARDAATGKEDASAYEVDSIRYAAAFSGRPQAS